MYQAELGPENVVLSREDGLIPKAAPLGAHGSWPGLVTLGRGEAGLLPAQKSVGLYPAI